MWDPTASVTHFEDTEKELFRQMVTFPGLSGPNMIENFTRVIGFGEDQNHWVSITADRKDPNVFDIRQHVIAANVPAYTPPTG